MSMSRRPSRLAALRLLAAIAISGGAYAVYLMACASNTTAPTPAVSPPMPTHGMYAVPYSQTFTVTNSNDTYTWTVSDPANLPPHVTMSTGGILSGTPATAGIYNFHVVATSTSGGANYTVAMCLNIFFQVTPAELPAGTVGVAYSQQLSGIGGTAPYGTWALFGTGNQLPTGVMVGGNGLLSGTPAAGSQGTYIFTVQGFDANQAIGRKTDTLTILVAGSPLTITTTSPLTGGTVGTVYSTTFAAAGGTSPYTWAITSAPATVPPGLALSPAGVLSGTPTGAGTFTITVQATDAAAPTPHTASGSFTVTIAAASPPLTITTTSPLPGATVGVVYNTTGVQFAASGGTSPYTWLITSAPATVPPGLSLSGAGLLSGTPTGTGGAYTFTVQATDAASHTASGSFGVTVVLAPVTITTTSPLPAGSVGAAYTTPLAASGGTGTYVWSVTAGAVPTGLTLNADGTWAGTPTVANTFTFTAKATSGTATPASKAFSLTINHASTGVTITTTSPLPDATVAVLYNDQLNAAGGTPPYTWKLTSVGSPPPAGISLSTSGLVSGVASSPATASFPVTVTDNVGATATASLTLKVDPAAPACAMLVNGSAITGSPYVLPSVANGGHYGVVLTVTSACLSTSPASSTWTSSGLPAPFDLSPATGTTSNIESTLVYNPGTYTFSVTFTGLISGTGANVTQQFQITITP